MDREIVFLDTENRTIYIFGQNVNKVSFDDYYLLPIFLNGKNVFYISDIQEVSGDSIIETVTDFITSNPNDNLEPRYIRSKVEGFTRISGSKLSLAGPKNPKLIDEYIYNLILESLSLHKLIAEGKVEIITETEANKYRKNLKIKTRDDALDDMLVKTSAKDFADNLNFIDEEDMDEITDETKVESENESIIKQMGITDANPNDTE